MPPFGSEKWEIWGNTLPHSFVVLYEHLAGATEGKRALSENMYLTT